MGGGAKRRGTRKKCLATWKNGATVAPRNPQETRRIQRRRAVRFHLDSRTINTRDAFLSTRRNVNIARHRVLRLVTSGYTMHNEAALTCTRGSTASSTRSESSALSFCTRPLIIKSRGWILFTAFHATCVYRLLHIRWPCWMSRHL